ncbi:MAG: sugar transferase, partial [Luteibaculum sp.]
MNKRRQVLFYILADALAAGLAWISFYVYRKIVIEHFEVRDFRPLIDDPNFLYALCFIPIFWLGLYTAAGMYNKIYRRHRIKELSQVAWYTVLGVTILFFVFILDDQIPNYKSYYQSYFFLLASHFFFTFCFRFLLTNHTVKRVFRREIGFNTIIIGGGQIAWDMYQEINSIKNYPGYKFVGYVSVNGKDRLLSEKGLEHLGELDQLHEQVEKFQAEEILIAIESSEHQNIGNILNKLDDLDINIKIIPDMYDIMAGSVKMTSIFGTPLIEVNPEIMSSWEFTMKRLFDICMSLVALILLSPVYLVLSILVYSTTPGPV